MLVVWLVGCLFFGLVGWLVGWLAVCFAGGTRCTGGRASYPLPFDAMAQVLRGDCFLGRRSGVVRPGGFDFGNRIGCTLAKRNGRVLCERSGCRAGRKEWMRFGALGFPRTGGADVPWAAGVDVPWANRFDVPWAK